jgi:hypothetical protein
VTDPDRPLGEAGPTLELETAAAVRDGMRKIVVDPGEAFAAPR